MLSNILLVLTTAFTLMIVGLQIFSICYGVRGQNRYTKYEEKRYLNVISLQKKVV